MTHACANFESIESAHDYVSLLAETVADAKIEIDGDIQRELSSSSKSARRLEALRMVSYSLEKLALHTRKSGRILNDLRSLRRLLFEERVAPQPVADQPHAPAVAKKGVAIKPDPGLRGSAPGPSRAAVA